MGRRGGRRGKVHVAEKAEPRKREKQVSRRKQLLEREKAEIEKLTQRIADEAPKRGSMNAPAKQFDDLPISAATLKATNREGFRTMTEIQSIAIPHALAGRDILGAAKTGSGKTLAFLIPTLERLFRRSWSTSDGLGALILTPTRELALQIFEVLRRVGEGHSVSAGLVLGGKDFALEQSRITLMNVLVSTPGRLRQHLEQTPGFDTSGVEVLVLDEADRILDMGFEDDLNAILDALPGPEQRQTLLFSATQTRKVRDLARLSLRRPEFLAVHEREDQATPDQLNQRFLSVPLPDKVNVAYSFVKSHAKSKIILFVSSCKQAKFLGEVFRLLNPGVKVHTLHGKIKQLKRMAIYYDFLDRPHVVLIATDVAARGLDFPAVDWVIQMDCPEDKQTYIHRAGRTARFNSGGNALLFLDPAEEAMVEVLRAARIPLKKTAVNPDRTLDVRPKLQALLAEDGELRALAQKAFVSYMRSVFLQPNKDVFSVDKLDQEGFAESLGLASAPRIKFSEGAQTREEARKQRNPNYKLEKLKEAILRAKERKRQKREEALQRRREREAGGKGGAGSGTDTGKGGADSEDEDEDDDDDSVDDSEGESDKEEEEEEEANRAALANARSAEAASRRKGLLQPKGANALSSARATVGLLGEGSGEDEDGDGLLVLKRTLPATEDADAAAPAVRKPRKLRIDSQGTARGLGKRVVFDDDGKEQSVFERMGSPAVGAADRNSSDFKQAVAARVQAVRDQLLAGAETDREAERERVRQMHRKRRLKERKARQEESGGAAGVALAADATEEAGDVTALYGWTEDDSEGEGGGKGEGEGGSDSGSEDGADSGSDEGEEAPRKRARAAAPARSVEEAERLALAALGGRK